MYCSGEEAATRAPNLYIGISVSLAAVLVATYFALTIDRFGWDVDITRWLQGYSLGSARFLRGWIFWMGVRGVAGVTFAIAFGAFWLKRRRIEALFLALVSVPDLFNALLRDIIGRPRPSRDLVEVIGGPQGFSFPSGTTIHSLLFYGLLLYLVHPHLTSRRTKYLLWAAAASYAVLSGLWVIYDGRHWFTDTMGGYLYGTLYLLVLIAAYRKTKQWVTTPQDELAAKAPRIIRRQVGYVLRLIQPPSDTPEPAASRRIAQR